MSAPLEFALWLSALHTLTFLGVWGGFALLFRRGLLRRFQIASGKPPEAALYTTAVREVLTGQLLFPIAVYFAVYPLWTLCGGSMSATTPPPFTFALHILAFMLLNDTIFYWSHRLLHTRWLFTHVHYRHHRFRIVRGPTAEFAHPLESLFNFIAMFAGPVVLGTPFPVLCAWVVLRMFETVEAHSGYTFTIVSSRHSFHHLHAQRGCYGSFVSPWDALCGTDRMWRAQRKAERAAASGGAPVASE